MSFFLKAIVLVVLFLSTGLAKAEENLAADSTKETKPPALATEELLKAITLDEATKQVMQDTKNKVLAAKTEVVAGRKIHVIKILTSTGHIQHIKIDAMTGKTLDNPKK